jgi:hypothetical protein
MADMGSPLAPTNPFPERQSAVFEAKLAPDAPGQVGPTRFEEGLATDPSVPSNFVLGITSGRDPSGSDAPRLRSVDQRP